MGILGANRTEDLLVARNEIVSSLIVLILHHNEGVIILDTDTLWTQNSHGKGGSYAESVTLALDDLVVLEI